MSALHNTSYDIICAQELRLTSQADVEDVRARWEKGTSIVSRGCDKADGVAIFFKSNAEIIKTREIIPGRILLVDCFYLNLKMRIINIYTTQDAATKVRMFKKLYELLLVGFYTVLSGDFNSYTEANDRIPVPTNPRSRNREGDALKKMSESCGVKDVFRVLHPFDVGYTRFDARIKTRIDRIYVTADITPVSYKTRVLVNSDHLAVIALLKFGKTEKKGFWKLNVNCLKNNDVITELKKEVVVTKSLKVLTMSHVELWEVLKERLRYFFKFKCRMLNQEQNAKYSALMARFVDLKTKANKTEMDTETLSEMEIELAKLNDVSFCLRLQAGMGDTACPTNVHSLAGIQKKKLENKHVGPILNEYGLLIEDEKTKRETIREMCEKLYRKCDINMSSLQSFLGSIILNRVDLISEGGVITPDEVREAISQLRKGKSPGPDGLPNEFYLSCSDMLVDLLTSAFNDGIKVGKMHASFYHGVISVIYKKGPFPNLDNWRHVTIMNVDYKILAKIVANRLNDDLEKLVENVPCAIKRRLMWDNLCILRDITSGNVKDEIFLISLDQKKAFDYVSRE